VGIQQIGKASQRREHSLGLWKVEFCALENRMREILTVEGRRETLGM
jgi:hypothetical protein